MSQSILLDELIDAFKCLPGVGNKSAQRMAFYLLERERAGGKRLADKLTLAMEQIDHCQQCRNFCETDICKICSNQQRHSHQICIVESPADVMAFEQAAIYSGYYFVLMGHLSPLDGIGPEELGLDKLKQRFADEHITEIILATNLTVEGEATAHYIQQLAEPHDIAVTRIAQGIPVGGELEYIDQMTLSQAFSDRKKI